MLLDLIKTLNKGQIDAYDCTLLSPHLKKTALPTVHCSTQSETYALIIAACAVIGIVVLAILMPDPSAIPQQPHQT